jgi:hypothetical protein
MTTLQTAAVLFALGAAGGVAMLVMRVRRGTNPPVALAVLHGGAVGFALALLGVAVLRDGVGGLAQVAFGVFALGALGGATLFTMHMRGRLLPVPFVLVHGTVAVIAYVLLLVHVLGGA